MNQLETLLNTLIQMGGKPFDLTYITKCEVSDHGIYFYEGECSVEFCSYRELVSLESGLWQFVCENKLYKEHNGKTERYFDFNEDDYLFHYAKDHQYRLLESALIPEEELAKFLVDNIKVEGKKE